MNTRNSVLTRACILSAAILSISSAVAAPLPPSYPSNSGALFEAVMHGQTPMQEANVDANASPDLAPNLQRQVVSYPTPVAAGTIVVDPAATYLYFVLGDGKAIRYGIGVGREGFGWSGSQAVTRKAEWPDWTPPQEMIARQPYLPRWMAGGIGNPLGARAMYLGSTVYRIHGTNAPETIGHLYSRVDVGTKVLVLPNHDRVAASIIMPPRIAAPRAREQRMSSIY